MATLIEGLVSQAERRTGARRAVRIHILVGVLSNISPSAVQRQFERLTAGSPLAGVELVFHPVGDPLSPDALAVRVTGVDYAR